MLSRLVDVCQGAVLGIFLAHAMMAYQHPELGSVRNPLIGVGVFTAIILYRLLSDKPHNKDMI